MKIALAQMDIIPARPDLNTTNIINTINTANTRGADIIIFPEMSVSGYLLGDIWEETAFLRDCEFYGKEIIKLTSRVDTTVIFGNVAIDWHKKNKDGRVRKYNALFVAQNGLLISPENTPYPYVIKTFLGQQELNNSKHFCGLLELANELASTPQKIISPVTVNIAGTKYNIAAFIGEDICLEESSSSLNFACEHKIDLLINIATSPYATGKTQQQHIYLGNIARSANAPLIYVNAVGLQNTGKTIYTFNGSSACYADNGKMITQLPYYENKLDFINLDQLKPLEKNYHNTSASSVTFDDEKYSEIAEIYTALRYGIRQFLSLTKINKVVIGISGGIDSAVSAALYVDIIGSDNVLLVNMPSQFNSNTTKDLSAKLADNLGTPYIIMPIEDSVTNTIAAIEKTPLKIKNNIVGYLTVSSFVAENIQARDRSSRILAGIAAAWGGGFTCNANKTETSVGYSTLYGDNTGFLAAMGDLWKYQVYALANYLNDHIYQREVIPQGIIDIVPSAELSLAQNVDEGKGDPLKYPYHDYLLRAFMERQERATPKDIISWYQDDTLETNLGIPKGLVSEYFPTAKEFIADLERWWGLYKGMAVAKRIQSPPILALSHRAYGSDHNEFQGMIYFSRHYQELKMALLGEQ